MFSVLKSHRPSTSFAGPGDVGETEFIATVVKE